MLLPFGGGRPSREEKKSEVDSSRTSAKCSQVTTVPSSPRAVVVRAVPIELCQFIKFGGLAGSGGEAKQLIADGSVQLNDRVETQKRKKLGVGDRVTLNGQTLIVQLA